MRVSRHVRAHPLPGRPLFVKYNDLLRGFGRALEGCRGNKYVTTTHAINSCIVKCSKLTQATIVYRGVSGGVLPQSFWKANQQGVRGGIEAAFVRAMPTAQPSSRCAQPAG